MADEGAVIGILIGLGGIGVTIWAAWYARQHKRLAFGVTMTDLLTVKAPALDRLEVRFAGEEIPSLRSAVVVLQNWGAPIRASDHAESPTVRFGPDARVLAAEVVEHGKAANLPAVLVQGNSVGLPPFDLNPKHRILMRLLVAGDPGKPKLTHQIAGLSRVTETRAQTSPRLWPLVASALLALGGSLIMITTPTDIDSIVGARVVGGMCAFLALIFLLAGALQPGVDRRFVKQSLPSSAVREDKADARRAAEPPQAR